MGRDELTDGERSQVRNWVWEQACGEWDDKIVNSDTESLCTLIGRIIRDRRALAADQDDGTGVRS